MARGGARIEGATAPGRGDMSCAAGIGMAVQATCWPSIAEDGAPDVILGLAVDAGEGLTSQERSAVAVAAGLGFWKVTTPGREVIAFACGA